MPNVLKSGSLKFLEPLGHTQSCNGIAFNRLTKTIWSETMYQIVHNIMKTLVHNVEPGKMYGIIRDIKALARITDLFLPKSEGCPLIMPPIKCTAYQLYT